MSITTTADLKLDSAREHLKFATMDLQEIVINECWGHDEFYKEFQKQLFETYIDLVRISKKLYYRG